MRLGWADFVERHPDGTVFQSPEMYELFAKSRRMKPVVIGLYDEDSGSIKGILQAVIIREMKGLAGYFSSRTVIYGGPLVETGGKGDKGKGRKGDGETGRRGEEGMVLHMLLEELIRQVKNHSIFIQFRNFNSQEENKALFSKYSFHHRDRLNLIVDTTSRETVIKNMSASRWRQIRKGLGVGRVDKETRRQGEEGKRGDEYAKITEPENIDQVRDFYDILFNLYKYKVKKPLPAWDFFEQFYHISRESRLGIIRLVQYKGKIIGGILSPVTPGKTIYEWYVCGLDQQYKEVHPSVLATWAAIEYAVENDIPRFDFMGVGIPEREYGVREFKSRFGGEQLNFGRFARVNNRIFYFAAETGYNLLALLKKI